MRPLKLGEEKKTEEEKRKNETTGQKYNGLLYSIGRPLTDLGVFCSKVLIKRPITPKSLRYGLSLIIIHVSGCLFFCH